MAATQPTRRPWHSGDDGIWANAPAGADAESAPSDGEKDAGHLTNTGLTSGRLNWFHALLGEWFQRVRDTLLPQHEDAGGHSNVTIIGTAASTKCTITSSAGEAASTKLLNFVDADGAQGGSIDKEGDAIFRTLEVGHATNGAAGVTKLLVKGDNGDAASDRLIRANETGGTEMFGVWADGSVVAAGKARALGWLEAAGTVDLGPGDFSPLSPYAGDALEFHRTYGTVSGDEYMISRNADTTPRYFISGRVPIPRGSTVSAIYVRMDRIVAGQTCLMDLRYKEFNTSLSASVSTCGGSGAGTGARTESTTGLSHLVPSAANDPRHYYVLLTLDNQNEVVGNAIKFIGCEIAYG